MREHGENPREESGVHHLAALLRSDTTEAVDGGRIEAGWRRLLWAVHEDDGRGLRRPRTGRYLALGAVAAAAVVAILVFGRFTAQPSPLQFKVDGAKPAHDYLESENGHDRKAEFSDGSSLVLHAPGRLRVANTHVHGATVFLERGQLDVSIVHRASARWQLVVGPYRVDVTGTRFAVTWDPEAGDFGVDLLDGAVNITGPGISSPLQLQAGQRFRANRMGSFAVRSQPLATPPHLAAGAEPLVEDYTVAVPKPRRVASATGSERANSPSRSDRPTCDWGGLVSSGQFEATVTQARSLGVRTALAECPARGLFALADAARYLGKFDLSQNALMAIRRRSPDDRGKAAFFLGRLEEARGNLELALSWYSQAMGDNTELQFAEEAKAGKSRVGSRIRSSDSRSSGAP
jgi:transmembrane sensor